MSYQVNAFMITKKFLFFLVGIQSIEKVQKYNDSVLCDLLCYLQSFPFYQGRPPLVFESDLFKVEADVSGPNSNKSSELEWSKQ